MSYVHSIKDDPVLELELVELNPRADLRPVLLKVRRLEGILGLVIRILGPLLSADSSPEALGHHALQIGNYAYELHCIKAQQNYLFSQRLTGPQIWFGNVSEDVVGWCDFTDAQIAIEGTGVVLIYLRYTDNSCCSYKHSDVDEEARKRKIPSFQEQLSNLRPGTPTTNLP